MGKKALNQRFGANLKNIFFAKFHSKFVPFLYFFSFLAQKMLKMKISTSNWGAQHSVAGRNIQQASIHEVTIEIEEVHRWILIHLYLYMLIWASAVEYCKHGTNKTLKAVNNVVTSEYQILTYTICYAGVI